MKEDLKPYYENELSFIRNLGKEFAATYDKIAGRLALEPGKCEDPHVERLIEAFALIAGRIHHKIDQEFPEITESLLSILYPHYLRPIPSMSIAQFCLDPDQAALTKGHRIDKDTPLYTRPIAGKGAPCVFRTCYPVTLWPLEITAASALPAAGVSGAPETAIALIRLDLKCLSGARLSALDLSRLRFYLNAESHVAHLLYEILFNNVISAVIRSTTPHSVSLTLPADTIQAVGFGKEEGMLPYPDRSFIGYRILQEYFSFPGKYFFFDLTGFEKLDKSLLARVGETFQILLYVSPFERRERLRYLEQNVNRDTFQLGCCPIVNLFERLAEPVRITQIATEYRIVPDVHRQLATEVYSVDEVASVVPDSEKAQVYEPFYSLRHAYEGSAEQAYWYASRRSSEKKGDRGTEVYLTLVNPQFSPARPSVETLSVRVTCTNRDLAGQLPFTKEFGELSLEGAMVRARCLLSPTKTVRLPLREGLQWRLISHLALNYLSLVQGGRDALQEILKLYDVAEDPTTRRQIAGIVGLSSQQHISRLVSRHGIVFVQGQRVDLEFDEDEFVGTGVFLFASVLDRFLGLYTALNSFTQLTVRTRQRKGVLKQWPPRSGEQILL